MKFSEAIEHLSKGRTLEYGEPGNYRTIKATNPPHTADLRVTTDDYYRSFGLEWLESLILESPAGYVHLVPRTLPALPNGYLWDVEGSHVHSVIGPGGQRIPALRGQVDAEDASKQAAVYTTGAAILRALVEEFEAR